MARSLYAKNKDYVKTFETLYVSEYLMAQDDDTLNNLDKAALNKMAFSVAVNAALENNIEISQDIANQIEITGDEEYHYADIVNSVRKAVDSAYQLDKLQTSINGWQAQGLSKAQIFTELYLWFQRKEMEEYDKQTAAETVEDTTSTFNEQTACVILLESQKLSAKSLKSIQKICDNLPKETQTATETVKQSNAESENIISEDDKKFAQLLGEIAIEDMKTQKIEGEKEQQLIDQIKPLIYASYGFNSSAYQTAYQTLLENQ